MVIIGGSGSARPKPPGRGPVLAVIVLLVLWLASMGIGRGPTGDDGGATIANPDPLPTTSTTLAIDPKQSAPEDPQPPVRPAGPGMLATSSR